MKVELNAVINLMHSTPTSTLATQSIQMSGYPYATAVPNILDEQHQPVLLISALAEHTKNLLADSKVSISMFESGAANVQDGQRLTIVGDAEQFEPSDKFKARYLRYLPAAERYLQLDFMFFRIAPKRLRYIGGVGQMGWVESEELNLASSLLLDEEAELLQEAQELIPRNITLLGIDAYGIDYLAGGFRDRAVFKGGVFSRDEFLALVSKLN